jgi:hypothetical protein
MDEFVIYIVQNIQIHANEIITPLYMNYYVRIYLFKGEKYTDSYKRNCNFVDSKHIGMCEFVLSIVQNIEIRANEIV